MHRHEATEHKINQDIAIEFSRKFCFRSRPRGGFVFADTETLPDDAASLGRPTNPNCAVGLGAVAVGRHGWALSFPDVSHYLYFFPRDKQK